MSDKYSLLIMRDSSEKVRRLRLSIYLIKFLLVSFLVLILLTIGGIIFSIYSIGQYANLVSESNELRASLADANIQLERLQDYGALLKDSEEVARLQMPLNEESGAKNQETDTSEQTEELNTTEVVASIFPDAVNATLEQSAEAQNTPSDSADPGVTVEKSPAKVSNMEIKARSPKSVRLAFDIINEHQGVTLVGNIDLALITKKDEVLNVIVPKNDMIFQINYYKRMSTAFPLPENLSLADIKSLRMIVHANGKRLQTETFSFP